MNYKKLKKIDFKQLKEEGEENESRDIYDNLLEELTDISNYCATNGVICKIIIEVEALDYNEIKLACDICKAANVDFIKTSTGFYEGQTIGTKVEKVNFIRQNIPDYIKIKISGGIRTKEDVDKFNNNFDRIGSSNIIK